MTTRTRLIINAMCCAAAVTAQFIAGKALRDALFLTSVSAASLPLMLVITSVVSIVLVGASARFSERLRPSVFVPAFFQLGIAAFSGGPHRVALDFGASDSLALLVSALLFFVARLLDEAQRLADDHSQIV